MLLVSLLTRAQIEYLDRHDVKGDPMLGTKDCVAWVGNNIQIVERDDSYTTFTLNNNGLSHIFVKGAIIIGYYKNDGDFLFKTESYTNTIEQGSQRESFSIGFSNDSVPYSEYSKDKWVLKNMWRVKASDIMRWLRESDGYIRIVAPMYGGNRLDLKFALKKNEE